MLGTVGTVEVVDKLTKQDTQERKWNTRCDGSYDTTDKEEDIQGREAGTEQEPEPRCRLSIPGLLGLLGLLRLCLCDCLGERVSEKCDSHSTTTYLLPLENAHFRVSMLYRIRLG